MNLLKRVKFALTHQIDHGYVVFSIGIAHYFTHYEDAKEYAESQVQYCPQILVVVSKNGDA